MRHSMKDVKIHPQAELPTLARLIQASTASWRGVAAYVLAPTPGQDTIDPQALPHGGAVL